MAKKAQPKAAASKARVKTAAPKKAAAPTTVANRPAASKYDQPGAPWWKKFRSTASAANR